MSNDVIADSLRRALAELQATQAEIGRVFARSDERWRHDLVACRRRLQQNIQSVAGLLDQVGAEAEGGEVQRLRNVLRQLRSLIASHQADWPAVAIDHEDPGYQASIAHIREVSINFAASLSALLRDLGKADPRPADRSSPS